MCLFVCYMGGTPESPLPLNPGQGSDSPGTVAVTRSTSVKGQSRFCFAPRVCCCCAALAALAGFGLHLVSYREEGEVVSFSEQCTHRRAFSLLNAPLKPDSCHARNRITLSRAPQAVICLCGTPESPLPLNPGHGSDSPALSRRGYPSDQCHKVCFT